MKKIYKQVLINSTIKEMADKNLNYGFASYILGIISIVLAVISPPSGLILGIIGLTFSKKEKSEVARRGEKFSKIAIIISVIFFALSLLAGYFISQNFPIV